MMIDNSVIVTENITRRRQSGLSLADACDKGTSEMITPLLSSSLTTVAVFLPLISHERDSRGHLRRPGLFHHGGPGRLLHRRDHVAPRALQSALHAPSPSPRKGSRDSLENHRPHRPRHDAHLQQGGGLRLRPQMAMADRHGLRNPLCFLFFKIMRVERMPAIEQTETMARIDWNEKYKHP